MGTHFLSSSMPLHPMTSHRYQLNRAVHVSSSCLLKMLTKLPRQYINNNEWDQVQNARKDCQDEVEKLALARILVLRSKLISAFIYFFAKKDTHSFFLSTLNSTCSPLYHLLIPWA